MDRVCKDHAQFVITRSAQQHVVVVSLEHFNALEETGHPLRSPANARRLLSATKQLGGGRGRERELLA